MDRRQDLTRRQTLGCLSAAVFWIGSSSKASAADGKFAKSVVQYTDRGTQQGRDCDDCVQYIPGKTPGALGGCKVVEGDIDPHGHCLAFSPKKTG